MLATMVTPAAAIGQTSSSGVRSLSSRLTFEAAQQLIRGEDEGNLWRQPNRFTRTRLRDGRIIEIYYPLPASGRSMRGGLSGYGLLYSSEKLYLESIRPRHMLEDLLPDGQDFISRVPQLIARLEKRLGLASGRLELNRMGLRRIDLFLRHHHATHSTAEADPRLFQELTAAYGEILRRAVKGEWQIHKEQVSAGQYQPVPSIVAGSGRELKPWSVIIRALHDEDNRRAGLTGSFDADVSSNN